MKSINTLGFLVSLLVSAPMSAAARKRPVEVIQADEAGWLLGVLAPMEEAASQGRYEELKALIKSARAQATTVVERVKNEPLQAAVGQAVTPQNPSGVQQVPNMAVPSNQAPVSSSVGWLYESKLLDVIASKITGGKGDTAAEQTMYRAGLKQLKEYLVEISHSISRLGGIVGSEQYADRLLSLVNHAQSKLEKKILGSNPWRNLANMTAFVDVLDWVIMRYADVFKMTNKYQNDYFEWLEEYKSAIAKARVIEENATASSSDQQASDKNSSAQVAPVIPSKPNAPYPFGDTEDDVQNSDSSGVADGAERVRALESFSPTLFKMIKAEINSVAAPFPSILDEWKTNQAECVADYLRQVEVCVQFVKYYRKFFNEGRVEWKSMVDYFVGTVLDGSNGIIKPLKVSWLGSGIEGHNFDYVYTIVNQDLDLIKSYLGVEYHARIANIQKNVTAARNSYATPKDTDEK